VHELGLRLLLMSSRCCSPSTAFSSKYILYLFLLLLLLQQSSVFHDPPHWLSSCWKLIRWCGRADTLRALSMPLSSCFILFYLSFGAGGFSF
jgi:hypothetical protein